VFSEELHLPVNKQITPEDGVVGCDPLLWVPEFRIKQDVVPGRVTEYRITPNLVGETRFAVQSCVVLPHFEMERPVIVDSPTEFEAWDGCKESRSSLC